MKGDDDQETVQWTVSPKNGTPASTAARNGGLGIVLGPMADNASPRNEILRTSKCLGRTI